MPPSNGPERSAAAKAAATGGGATEETGGPSSCSLCGRDVPAANLVLHEATCGRVRSHRGRSQTSGDASRPKPSAQSAPAPVVAPPSQPESRPEPSQARPSLPRLERGQTTLDGWLATAKPSSTRGGGGGAASLGATAASSNFADNSSSGGVASPSNGGNGEPGGPSRNSTAGPDSDSVNGRGHGTPSSSDDEDAAAASDSAAGVDSDSANESRARAPTSLIDGNAASSDPAPPVPDSAVIDRNAAATTANDEDHAPALTNSNDSDSTSPASNTASINRDAAATSANDGGAVPTSANSNDSNASGSASARGRAGNTTPYSLHRYNGNTDVWSHATRNDGDGAAEARPLLQPREGGDAAPDDDDEGWVNVTYNPQFRRGPNGIHRVRTESTFLGDLEDSLRRRLPPNPLVHGGPLGTLFRVLNGLLNGAVVGCVLFDLGGLLLGTLLGGAAGIVVDRARSAADEREERTTREVADMLATDDGGIAAGTVRVHRGSGYVTALASDGRGRERVIRVRYGDGHEARRLRSRYGLGPRPPETGGGAAGGAEIVAAGGAGNDGDAILQRAVILAREEIERSLLEILVQMSYSRDFGPGPGRNIILQPEESFEELVQRFGLGNESRSASREVIDSYPVEIVRGEEPAEGEEGEESTSESDDESDDESDEDSSEGLQEDSSDDESGSDSADTDDESSRGSSDSDGSSDMGTCGICLDNYREGDLVKRLACPNHPHCFHRDCIDKWLKLQASCPMCKTRVGMYKAPTSSPR